MDTANLIKALRCCQFDGYDSCSKCPMHDKGWEGNQPCYRVLKGLAADWIEQHDEREAIQSECTSWIKVEDALPKCIGEEPLSDNVLVLDENSLPYIAFYEFTTREWVPCDESADCIKVRYWMPVPKEPEGKESEARKE